MFFMPCLFYAVTGLYCPGCGGTRAVRYLLQGELLLSFRFHPLVPYAALVALLEAAAFLAAKAGGRRRFCLGYEKVFLYAAAGIVAVNFVAKNVLLVWCGIDLLAKT